MNTDGIHRATDTFTIRVGNEEMNETRLIKCDNCGEMAPATQQDALPDSGWWFPYDHFGYYGGFTDSIDVLLGQEPGKSFIICHDCVKVVLRFMPGLAKAIGKGNHPNMNKPHDFQHPLDVEPCCEWCWTSVRHDGEPSTAYIVQDGKWVNMKAKHVEAFIAGDEADGD